MVCSGFDIIVFVWAYIALQLRHGSTYVLGSEYSLYDFGRQVLASGIPHTGFIGASVQIRCLQVCRLAKRKKIALYRWLSLNSK